MDSPLPLSFFHSSSFTRSNTRSFPALHIEALRVDQTTSLPPRILWKTGLPPNLAAFKWSQRRAGGSGYSRNDLTLLRMMEGSLKQTHHSCMGRTNLYPTVWLAYTEMCFHRMAKFPSLMVDYCDLFWFLRTHDVS